MNFPFITDEERQALGHELYTRLAAKYGVVEFVRTEEHPEVFKDSWLIVHIASAVSEEKMIEIEEYAATITTDILLRTGRYIGFHVEEEPAFA
ncbi:MAG: hypothetical protein ACOVSW_11610 [Candidatus Kapaibacteriota bacterium]|jgi:hypothetical protein